MAFGSPQLPSCYLGIFFIMSQEESLCLRCCLKTEIGEPQRIHRSETYKTIVSPAHRNERK